MSENPVFSYTKRDYEGSRQEGLAKIPVLSKGVWTDLNATDPGVIILDYVHALVDMVNYYQDHQALEVFLSTAKERANIFRIAKQLSYKVRSAKGAVCDVEIATPLVYDYSIKIPKYTALTTNTGINYLTSEDAYIKAGDSTVTVSCVQGTLNIIHYQGSGVSRFSNMEGAANQSLRLSPGNVDVDTISIIDSLGRVWKPVDYISFSSEIDRVYQVDLNPDDSVTIRFGDGERGIVPQETDYLTVTYMTTLAEEGRVGRGAIVSLAEPFIDDRGQYIELLVNNLVPSTGGSNSQSSREIRDLAPGVIKAQDRAITLSDFEYLAKMVDGVADARAYDINIKPDLCLYHEVKVLITPDDPNGSVDTLKSRVYSYLSQRMIPPTNLQVLTPTYKTVDVDVTVKRLDSITEGRLSYEIQQVVENYFSSRSRDIGEYLYPSDLIGRISTLEGVRHVISLTPETTVQVDEFSIVRLGKLNISIQ